MFDGLVERLGLDGRWRTLDLGCGTGQSAIPMAGRVNEVVAVDPEPGMLHWGRQAAIDLGVENVTWTLGDSARLERLDLGEFDAAVMAASFHWMDRAAVLRTLDGMIRPSGAVVIITGSVGGTSTGVPDRPAWAEAVSATRRRWLGSYYRWAGDSAGDQRAYADVRREHTEFLQRSAFSDVESFEVRWTREHDVDSLLGLQKSMSFTSPAALGERTDDFYADLRRELLEIEPSGVFVEPIRTEVRIGRRPQPHP